jgi:hypothetical protein
LQSKHFERRVAELPTLSGTTRIMTSTRKELGYVGAALCVIAFLMAIAGSAFILVVYAEERHSVCGTEIGLLRALSLLFAVFVGGASVGGCALASSAGLTSHWWRFFRNIAAGLGVLTAFVVRSNL